MTRISISLIIYALSFSAMGSEIADVITMAKVANAEIEKRYKITSSEDLVLGSVSLNDKPKQFSKNLLQFQFIDKGHYGRDEISEYVYTTYWVSFSLVTGRIESIGPSTYGTYKPITSDEYYK